VFCNYCGKPNPEDANFCSTCGKAIGDRTAVRSPDPPPAAGQTIPPQAAPASPVSPAATGRLALHDTVLAGHRFPVYSMAFSPDGHWLASGSLDRTARLWDLRERREVQNFPATTAFTSLDFSADGQMLALAASDMTEPVSSISLWNAGSPREVRTLTGHRGRCMCVRFHPDGHLLASTEGGTAVDIWDVASGRIIRTLKQGMLRSRTFGGAFRCSLAFSPNGRHLATRSWPVTIWDVYDGKQVMTLGDEGSRAITPVCIGFSADGQQLVEVRGDGTIRAWNAYQDQVTLTLGSPPDRSRGTYAVQASAVSSDARYAAIATYSSADQPQYSVAVWDLPSARRLGVLGLSDGSQALAFSPDGEWLAVTDTSYGNGQASGVITFRAMSQFT
jgi:WD40 repeat protein